MRKKDIVRDKKTFNTILKSNQYWKCKYFVIYMMKGETPNSRFGIAVGKKVGNAVIRNRLKRVYRSLIDDNKLRFPKTYDYIIIVRNESLNAGFDELNQSIQNFLDKRVEK